MNVRKLGHVLGILLLVALVAPFVVYAFPQVVGANHGLIVLSGSMEPKMQPGDAVIVKDVPASKIETNDVITFKTGAGEPPTSHRVIGVEQTENGRAFKTKGDANEEPDKGLVRPPNVMGEVIFVIPLIGYVINFANSQVGFTVLVLAPILLFVVSELWDFLETTNGADGSEEPAESAAEPTVAGAEATEESAQTSEESGSSFVITRSSLLLLLLMFLVYVPYSGYVAFQIRELWSFVVASGSFFGLLFVLGTYLFADPRDESGPAAASDADPQPPADALIRHGRLPPDDDRTHVPVPTVQSLVEMAVDKDDWVVFDAERETYFVPNGSAVYLCPVDGSAGAELFDGTQTPPVEEVDLQ